MHEPLLLAPGLNCTAGLFGPQIEALGAEREVIVIDHTQDDTIPAIAARALSSAPERFALAGLSMGGYIALEMMRMAPLRVSRLGLLDTSARPDTAEATERRLRLMEIARTDFSRVHSALWPNLVAPVHQADGALEGVVRRMADETGVDAFIRQERAIIGRADSRPFLASIAVPTLVLVGELDTLTPPEVAREMVDAIPGAHLAVVEGAGHLSTLEKPDDVTQRLMDWLQR